MSFGFNLIWYFNLLLYFVWLRITEEGPITEMKIWPILLIQPIIKMCIHLKNRLATIIRNSFIHKNGKMTSLTC